MTDQAKAFVYAGLTILAWSTVSSAFKLSLRSMAPMHLIFISMFTAACFLGLLIVGKNGIAALCVPKDGYLTVGLLGLILYGYYTLLFNGYALLPAQIAQPLNNTWALVLALLSSLILGQRLSVREFFFMLVAYSGVVVIALGGSSKFEGLSWTGLICIMASTILYAVYWIMNTKTKLPATQALFYSFGIAAALALGSLILRGKDVSLSFALPGVYVGLFELGIPYIFWSLALKYTNSVARISTMPFLVPFLALFWISLVVKEPIAWTTPVGLILLVGGTLMQQRAATRK